MKTFSTHTRRKPTRGTVQLYRALSKMGIASRSQALKWIVAGEIEVDGRVCRDPNLEVCPERAAIRHLEVNLMRGPRRVVLLYKPRGTITSKSDEQGRPTIYSLLPDDMVSLHAVGRLDWASTGLLLLTNDTRLSSWLTDPRNRVPRVYLVTVRGEVSESSVFALRNGMKDGNEILKPDSVEIRKASGRESHLVVTLTEGKNREIRRLFKACGHEVTRLKRVQYGNLSLGSLQPCQYREVPPAELQTAFPGMPSGM